MRWLAALAILAAIASGLLLTYRMGWQAGSDAQALVLADWKRQVEAQAIERREASRARYDDLQERFNELRSRPEKVRTVVREIEVLADDRCDSLPASYRRLWDAGYESGLRVGTATAAAGLDDASRVAVADAAAAAREARERFEENAARLTALQDYIRSVVLRSD